MVGWGCVMKKASNEQNNLDFDVAVIGGGPAGMMCAGKAAELGAKVVLIEKNKQAGKKLLITGKGRCNITNKEADLKKLVENYGSNGKFLFHALSVFNTKDVIEFFEGFGLKTKTERGKRVFPVSDKAQDVLNVLLKYLEDNKVTRLYNSEVVKIKHKNHQIEKLILKNREIVAKNYVICTGGKSYPVTGSTGDGYKWAKSLGHSIKNPSPSLVAVTTKEKWVKDLQGLSLKNVEISVLQDNRKRFKIFGECLFTHFGLSGPIVLSTSKRIGELLEKGEVKILLNLKPALDLVKLDKRIQRDFIKYQNKAFKNCLDDLLPRTLIPAIVKLSNIPQNKKVNTITKQERYSLVELLKNLEITISGLSGFNSAIITSGGVSLKEIDDKTMKSKIIDNLFFAGEVINVDGPTGGFNLQVCWSTGYLAGKSVVK